MATDRTFGPDGWTPERLGSLAGKTYFITGANSGTGFEAACRLGNSVLFASGILQLLIDSLLAVG